MREIAGQPIYDCTGRYNCALIERYFMKPRLEHLNLPADLHGLESAQLALLADEVRALIIRTVGATGGHLAANLGVVDLTLALLKVFEPSRDRILWDVSHQAYAYKILTDRRDRFATLRQHGGISGFLRRSESPYDAFGAGHAGTALSAALGMAAARDLTGGREHIVAVVGDGALGCGLSFEALNNVADTARRLIVVLNDNEMSISANVGSISRHLGDLLANPRYNRWKSSVETALARRLRPNWLRQVYYRLEEAIKGLFLGSALFEEFGLRYIGPIDGHDIAKLVSVLKIARDADRPILLHVGTVKGRGYAPAEAAPEAWHGTAPFDVATGQPRCPLTHLTHSAAFGQAIEGLAAADTRIVAITAAMPSGTGLSSFARRFPDRFFDVGIAEEHAMVFAAGLAAGGLRPIVPLYSTFAQRVVDYVMHDICLQNLPVILCLDRAGLVGDDGPTHHGLYDIHLFRGMPNLVVMQPADEQELLDMLTAAVAWERPVMLRYPRGGTGQFTQLEAARPLPLGRAQILKEGHQLIFWALGDMIPAAIETARLISARRPDLNPCVVNARFVQPLDTELLASQAAGTLLFATFENGAVTGGFGSALREALDAMDTIRPPPLIRFGWPHAFIPHGHREQLMQEAGLQPPQMADRILSTLSTSTSGAHTP